MSWTIGTAVRSTDGLDTFESLAAAAGSYSGVATWGAGCNIINESLMTALIPAAGQIPARIQTYGEGHTTGGATYTITFPVAVTAGNCLVLDFVWNAGFPLSGAAVTDSLGNAWKMISGFKVAGSAAYTTQFISVNCLGGACVVTITQTGSFNFQAGNIVIREYSGISHSPPVGAGPGSNLAAYADITGACEAQNQQGGAHVNVLTNTLVTLGTNRLLLLTMGAVTDCAPAPVATGGATAPITLQAWYVVNEAATGLTDQSTYLSFSGSGGHRFNRQTRQRGSASYTLKVSASDSYSPTIGSQIFLYDQTAAGYTLVFAGYVQDYEINYFDSVGDRFIDVNATSLEAAFDTIYADLPTQYTSAYCGSIVAGLYDKFCKNTGIGLGTIQASAVIVPVFNTDFESLSDLFTTLAATAGFIWWVDQTTRLLHFTAPTATAAPFTLTSGLAMFQSIRKRTDGSDYRNRQGVRLSYDAFPHSKEFVIGAGQTSITLSRPVRQVTNAWATLSTCNTATATFSGQPAAGDTVTIGPATGAWQGPAHVYGLNGIIVVNGFVQEVTQAGTSGGSAPTFSTTTGGTTVDNTVIWTCRGALGISTGSQTYTFRASLDNTQFGEVLIGATVAATVQNLADAINATTAYNGSPATSGRGLTFSLPTWENAQCNAVNVTATTFLLQQKSAGSGWVAAISESAANFSWSASNTSGGTSPQGSLGPGEGATISLSVYAAGTSTAAPGLSYVEGSAVITMATPLDVGSNLNIEYTRMDGSVIQLENTTLVTSRGATTGNSGKVQLVTDQSSQGLVSTSAGSGLVFGQGVLNLFDVVPNEIYVDLLRPGLQPGQTLTLAMTGYLAALNGTYLVEEIEGELIPTQPYMDATSAPGGGHYRYTATLLDVTRIGTWLDYWLAKDSGGGGSGGGGGGGTGLAATSGGGTAATPYLPTIIQEIPTGTLNGTNLSFTLSQTPLAGTLTLLVNIPQVSGTDYTLAGTTITFTNAPKAADAGWFTAIYSYT